MKSLRIFYGIGFIFSLYTALLTFSNSSFLNQFINESYTGLLYSAGSLLAIVGLSTIPKIIKKIGSRATMLLLILLLIIVCFINIFITNPIVLAIAFCFLFTGNVMFFLTNDIIIDQSSESSTIGTIRGNYLTVLNITYVLAPLVTGYMLARMGFSALYTLAIVLLIPAIILVLKAPVQKNVHNSKINIFHSLKKLWNNSDVRNIVFANFILQFFYAWMVIYTPIYLHHEIGIPWDTIGTIFSVMLFAFVLTEAPLGRLADKVLGEKELLFVGFLLMGTSTLLLYIIPFFTLPLLALILFTTRLGASCIEIMTETYFFKKVPSYETGIISIFRNTYPLSYIIAPIIAGGVITLFSQKHLFLFLGIICLSGIFLVIPIRDTK